MRYDKQGGCGMNEENYWQKFTDSGRVEDYLTYSRSRGQADMTESDRPEHKGESPNAGTGHSDGHNLKSGACR